MADTDKVPRIPAVEDLTPSDEYLLSDSLLRASRVEKWTKAKTGRKMIKHNRYLLELGKLYQHGECNICNHPLDDGYNIGMYQGYIIHRSCHDWPKSFRKTIDEAIQAYTKARKV